MGEFYVYLHLKADTGEVFYVGKGRGKRAWETFGRNPHWNNVKRKHGLVVKMWRTGLTEPSAFSEEVRKIAALRKKGVRLANLTDGGEGGSRQKQVEQKKKAIISFFEANLKLPGKKDEPVLYGWLREYCAKSRDTYDASFSKKMRSLGYADKKTSTESQDKILSFYAQNGRFPSAAISAERKLSWMLKALTSESNVLYNKDFDRKVRKLGYGKGEASLRAAKTEANKKLLREFVNRNKRFPSRYREYEQALQKLMDTYCSPSSGSFDPAFREEVQTLRRRDGIDA